MTDARDAGFVLHITIRYRHILSLINFVKHKIK